MAAGFVEERAARLARALGCLHPQHAAHGSAAVGSTLRAAQNLRIPQRMQVRACNDIRGEVQAVGHGVQAHAVHHGQDAGAAAHAADRDMAHVALLVITAAGHGKHPGNSGEGLCERDDARPLQARQIQHGDGCPRLVVAHRLPGMRRGRDGSEFGFSGLCRLIICGKSEAACPS